MSYSQVDYQFMSRAIKLAARGLYTTDPNPRVGCVIVRDGDIIGEAWHVRAGEAHAEVNAIKQAGNNTENATAYISLEPCSHTGRTPPCTDALLAAKISRVVAAMQDPNPRVAGSGVQQLREAGLQVEVGLLEAEARALNPGYIKRMSTGRPLVRNKLAMSLDGRTAMDDGESKWITSEAARLDVQRLRARSSAIVTGVGTVLADDPSMTVRLEGAERQPLRVIIDTNLSTPLNAKILKGPGKTLIVTCSDDQAMTNQLISAGAEVKQLPSHGEGGSVDLQAVLDLLADMHINEVLLETGATLSGAMLEAELIDELVIYMAPVIMGNEARGLYRLPHLQSMQDKIQLEITDTRVIGSDLRITAIPIY